MSSGNEHRAQKAREKQRKKRQAAQSKRGSRMVAGMSADKMEQASTWPVWDCWASADWRDTSTPTLCCFARKHDDGTVAAAFFELDLEERGVVSVATRAPTTMAAVTAEIAKLSEKGAPIVGVDPPLVVKMVETAHHFGEKRGHQVPSGIAHAKRIFGTVRAARSTEEIRVGKVDPNAPVAAETGGWLTGIKRRLGLG